MEPNTDTDLAGHSVDGGPTALEGMLASTLVDEIYKLYLGRAAKPEESESWLRNMQAGLSPADFIEQVKTCDEAVLHRLDKEADAWEFIDEPTDQDLTTLVAGLYRGFLGRSPTQSELEVWASASGMSFIDIARQIRDSDEAAGAQPSLNLTSAKSAIRLVYQVHLGRYPNVSECDAWASVVADGRPLDSCIQEIATSAEAESNRLSRSRPGGLSASEFVLRAYVALLDRCPTLKELQAGDRALRLEGKTGETLLMELFRMRDPDGPSANGPSETRHVDLMGTTKRLDRSTWRRAVETSFASPQPKPPTSVRRRLPFASGDEVTVSVIVSLYKGRDYIERFLSNLLEQTIFTSHCEAIIIDAASPDGEYNFIEPLLERHLNIHYHRMPTRVPIYEAWNFALEHAKGRYITNMNLDDLRRPASLETQAATLDALPFVDVVYQDFFYSFDPHADFDTIAKAGLRSRLPPVTAATLFTFNSPHHAPMWRRSLHQDVGLFDDTLISAGDYEFWLRCLQKGKTFFKLDEPHTAYLVNPDGISSNGDPKVAREIQAVKAKHASSLLSPALLEPFEVFGSYTHALGQDDVDWSTSRYEVAQAGLRAVGRRGLQPGAAP